jgi:Fe-S oxidoreductase
MILGLRAAVSLAVLFCFGFAAITVWWLLRYVAMGDGRPTLDNIPERVRGFMTYVVGQRRVIAEPAGVLHLFIFWGFIILQGETVEYLIRGLNNDFRMSMVMGHTLYNFMLLLQDVFGVLVLVAIVIGVVRRWVSRPRHVVLSVDAIVISTFIALLMITKFLVNGAEIAQFGANLGHDPVWTPVAAWTAHNLLKVFSPDSAGLEVTLQISYVIHLAVVGCFSIYVPFGKHLHLIGAMPNVFFRKLGPLGAIRAMDMEAEVESYGAAKVEDLSWKQLLDTYACTDCGRCEAYCPAFNTGKALNPMKVIAKVKYHLKDKGKQTLRLKAEDTEYPLLAGGIISKEELMACTTCGACVTNCPVFIEHVDTIIDMRRYLALMEADFSPEVSRTFKNMENNSNPWGISSSYRGDWADGLEIPMMSELSEAPEYLFWVGCAGSFDDRQKKVTQAFAKILKTAGISFAILGSEEGCTGDPARRIGNEYLYWMLATQNIETLNGYGVRKIVTACPHCFHTIGKEYPQLGGNYEVIHHSDFMNGLIREGALKLKPAVSTRVTYHDSCYIGRWNNSYDSPRDILNAVPGLKVQEMELNKAQSFCCGAGGGRMWMEEHEGKRINIERTDQALATDPEAIAVACPFCMTMFDDGLKDRGAEGVVLRDLAEIIAENLITDENAAIAAAE